MRNAQQTIREDQKDQYIPVSLGAFIPGGWRTGPPATARHKRAGVGESQLVYIYYPRPQGFPYVQINQIDGTVIK